MKRLLCIVGSMNSGGSETFLMKIYRRLDKSLYQMDFAVTEKGEGFYDNEIRTMGGQIFHIIPKSQSVLKNFIAVKNLVKCKKYFYVLRSSQHSLSALELFAAWKGGAKVLVYRSSNTRTASTRKMNQFFHHCFIWMPNYFANVRIAPSTAAAEFMFGKGCVARNRALLIYNALDLNEFNYSQAIRNECRKQLNLSGKFVVGHIGRMTHQKNHSFLLQVFKKIAMKDPDAILLLVGHGELSNEILAQVAELGVKDKVIFIETSKEIPRLLSAMDVFVFPSLYEGMPNTVIEAQAIGLPCVIADTITKECDITGLIQFLPLEENHELWAEAVCMQHLIPHMETHQSIKQKHYDINCSVKAFVEAIFYDKS